MKSRAEIKAHARSGFMSVYWPAVGILFLGSLIAGALSAIPFLGWILAIFVGTIVSVGMMNVSVKLYQQDSPNLGDLFTPFERYGRVLGGSLWMALWVFLWMLIFYVPFFIIYAIMIASVFMGIPFATIGLTVAMVLSFALLIPVVIKILYYFCTPYLLARHPGVQAVKALELSKKMMDGHKADVFIAELSFIGWILLSGLTFGILWVFYVGPYYQATMAGFFEEIKKDALEKGVITQEDLTGDQMPMVEAPAGNGSEQN